MFLNNLFSRLKWEFSEQVEVRDTFIQKTKMGKTRITMVNVNDR